MTEEALPEGIVPIEGPLPGFRVETAAATGVVYLNGAHVAEWTPAGHKPVLWMSGSSDYQPGRAVRGGVPLVFPWFGGGPEGDRVPAHGFARLATWHLISAAVSPKGTATLRFGLDGPQVTDAVADSFTHDYGLEMHVSLGETLLQQLVVVAGDEELAFEEGLHTYFAVGDVRHTHVEGLEGEAYFDKVTGSCATQEGLVTITAETDRIYESASNTRIVDEAWGRTIQIEKVGSAQTVVWNPWVDKSRTMTDFGDDEWPGMLCVETVNSREQSITLAPGQRHLMSQTISIL
ncbi:D-hexose-6-phosphate mutarotase [Brooklawnia cerclae]|nr:D-hexose-6-phosphate mutarotase [Brooklawnia cerclae]